LIEPVVGGDYTTGRHPTPAAAKAGSGRA